MTLRPERHLLLPLLAVSVVLAMTASVRALATTAVSLQLNLGNNPHWVAVQGTHVEEMSGADRPDYDVFRYGGAYYVYNKHDWYMSHSNRGDFNLIDEQSVPSDMRRVPRDHWRNYPAGWQNREDQRSHDTSASFQVDLGSRPRWRGVNGTRVKEIRGAQRPGYDMFRYGSNYYVYNNDRWYVSRNWRGQFTSLEDRSVPSELSRVPRDHWQHYPTGWVDERGNDRTAGHGRHNSADQRDRKMYDRGQK